jgi:sucrose-6-phosphate hydrolase SacC (GH32 family)
MADARPARDETLRPQFHFTAPSGWLNDPNGLVWLDGEWHLFYQWRPTPDDGPEKWWGHAVSRDLLHWTDLPLVLRPDEHGSAWSGSCVVDRMDVLGLQREKVPGLAAFYTAAGGKNAERRGWRPGPAPEQTGPGGCALGPGPGWSCGGQDTIQPR